MAWSFSHLPLPLLWASTFAVLAWPTQAQPLTIAPHTTGVWPVAAALVYDVDGRAKGIPYRASATLNWTLEGHQYNARLQLKAFLVGTRTQTSAGRLSDQLLQPERFVDEGRRPRRTTFDWSQHHYSYQRGSDFPVLHALPPQTQDRLSVFFQLGLATARLGNAPRVGHEISLPVAGFGAAQTWVFRYAGTEVLQLPAGSLTARKFERRPREADDTGMEIWLSPELGYLPARLRLIEANGDVIDQRLRSR